MQVKAPIPTLKQKEKVTAAPVDFFGASTVKKERKPVSTKVEVKRPPSSKNDEFSDEELFEDTSFLETLQQLDDKKNIKPKVNFILFLMHFI